MKRKLMIDGNAVYEIDEECMLRKRIKDQEKEETDTKSESKKDVPYVRRDME